MAIYPASFVSGELTELLPHIYSTLSKVQLYFASGTGYSDRI